MGNTISSASPSNTKPRRLARSSALLIIAIVAVGGLLLILLAASTLSVTRVGIAAYSTPVSQDSESPSSLEVYNVNGGVTLVSWDRSNLLVNGTVTARGLGASTNAIKFVESNETGRILFGALFPTSGIGSLFVGSYSVDIHVYVPQSAFFSSVHLITTNGNVQLSTMNATYVVLTTTNGNAKASGITTTLLSLLTTNGGVSFNCSSCGSVSATSTNGAIDGTLPSLSLTGRYTLRTTNGSLSLILPTSSSFKLTANTVNGGISISGLGLNAQVGHSLTFGTGTAIVNLDTTNGSITITGA